VTGLGSVYTNDGLVKAALRLLEPLFLGENALEPERVSEKLHQPLMQRVNQQNRREIPEYRPEDDRKIIQPCCDCAWYGDINLRQRKKAQKPRVNRLDGTVVKGASCQSDVSGVLFCPQRD
jgi:hypothetical protein